MNDEIYTVAAINAYLARFALTQNRIAAMLRARDYSAAAKVLTECDYRVTDGDIDDIIEAERARAFEKFMNLCTDAAVKVCVAAIQSFKTAIVPPHKTLTQAENEMLSTIRAHSGNIKNAIVRAYFDLFVKSPHDDALWDVAAELRKDLEGIGALFYWWAYKQFECVAVKIVLLGKKLHHTREQIMLELGGYYDRFKN